MKHERWVYPSDGSEPYLASTRGSPASFGVAFLSDLPDFVSPIDHKVYSGRAGLREHCKVHDVIPNADLKGLPTLQSNSDQRSTEQKRADSNHRKQLVIQQVNKHYR